MSEVTAPYLTNIWYIQIISEQTFPDNLKLADVTPDSSLNVNQIFDTLPKGSVGVSSKEFIEDEGIKYKEPIKLDKKINGYEHKCFDISSCDLSVLDEIRTIT